MFGMGGALDESRFLKRYQYCLHRLWCDERTARKRRVRSACFDLQIGKDRILRRRQADLPQFRVHERPKRLLRLLQREADRRIGIAQQQFGV